MSFLYFFRLFIPFFTLLLFQSLTAEQLKLNVAADAALLINADTGAVLFEKNSKTQYYPASITKVATAVYALNKKNESFFNDVITADQEPLASVTAEQKSRSNYKLPAYWQEVGGSHIGIKVGEKLTFQDLLYGMLIASGNDAANLIAQYVSGSIPNFMNELNGYLKDIGCTDTCFLNPHGLHHPDHKTTAHDMALIAQEGLKNQTFRQIVSTVRFTRPKTNKQEATTLVQTNRLLKNGPYHYPDAIGIKTGYHSKAFHTFVGAAQQDGRTLIVVLLHSKERNDVLKDSINLFETAFKQPKVQRTLLKAGEQKYALSLAGATKSAHTYIKEDIHLEYYPAEEPKVKALIYWDNVKLPIAKDEKIGELRIIASNGTILSTAPVYSANEVKTEWLYWIKQLFSGSSWMKWSLISFIILACAGLIFKFRR